MNRSKGLRRTGGPKRKRKPKKGLRGVGLAVENRHLFHDAAQAQRVCAAPGCRRSGRLRGIDFESHHVIYEQHLRDRRLPRYDARNALRLCPDCHKRHHSPNWRLPTSALTDDNVDYAFTVLGAYAADYFARYYDDREPDPRIAAAAAKECA